MAIAFVRRAIALSAGALLLSGCYKYRPIPVDLAPQGEEVQLTVTPAGAFELGEVTNVSREVPVIRGRFMGREGSSLLVQVPVAQRQDGIHLVNLQQMIRVPEGEVLGMAERHFDGTATALLVAGGAAAATGLLIGIIDAFGSGSDSGGGDPPDDTWIPLKLFSIPIG